MNRKKLSVRPGLRDGLSYTKIGKDGGGRGMDGEYQITWVPRLSPRKDIHEWLYRDSSFSLPFFSHSFLAFFFAFFSCQKLHGASCRESVAIFGLGDFSARILNCASFAVVGARKNCVIRICKIAP